MIICHFPCGKFVRGIILVQLSIETQRSYLSHLLFADIAEDRYELKEIIQQLFANITKRLTSTSITENLNRCEQ